MPKGLHLSPQSQVLAAIEQAKQTAIENGSYRMRHYQVCAIAGVSKQYFRSGTAPAVEAREAFNKAVEDLRTLQSSQCYSAPKHKASEPKPRKPKSLDTDRERCCLCTELQVPALSKETSYRDRKVIRHFCIDCLRKATRMKSA